MYFMIHAPGLNPNSFYSVASVRTAAAANWTSSMV